MNTKIRKQIEGRKRRIARRLDKNDNRGCERPIMTAANIGKRAGVVVNKAEGKYASAHDLRRSFGTRWAGRVKPATLQLLMRHKSIETTLKYYVAQDADDVADELWKGYKRRSKGDEVSKGNR